MTNICTKKKPFIKLYIIFLLIVPILFIGGCASVPKESVELSYAIGNDLETLHRSYKSLIESYFDSLRTQINSAIDRVFIPNYINNYVKTGKLVKNATNKRVDLVEAWARLAVETIDKERITRLEPINTAEKELLISVNDAFDKAIRANTTVTAHLNSIRKVKEVQDEILESLQLKDVRNKINNALIKISIKAKEITADIKAKEITAEIEKVKNQPERDKAQ